VSELLLRAGRIFTGDSVLRDGWLRVEEERIAEISSTEPRTSASTRRIEAPDATLLPGLIDCHVHLSIGGGPDWLTEVQESYALTCWKSALRAREALRAGFTTVRVLGGKNGIDVALRDAQAAGLLPAPRIVPANLIVCMTGGHAHWLGREADGPDEVRKAVREQLRAGADCIKLIATGGVMTRGVDPGAQQLTHEELCAGVEEAHKTGRPVAAHAHGDEGVKAAVLAGVDSIEHGSFMSDETLELMRTRGTVYSVTLCSARGFFEAPPGSVAEWAMAKARIVDRAMSNTFQRAAQAGVKLVLGTDAGTPFNKHGDNARELALMVRLGLDPLDALRAATRNGAELLRRSDDLGTLEVGKAADMVLCDGDAITDVERLCNRDNIHLVLQSGRIVYEQGI
jgi:imidazolonepropionase-like amidohydrolase